MKHQIKLLCLLTSAALLSGCAGMNSDLGCNQVQGMSACTSMWTVNKMANQGAFNNTSHVVTDPNGKVITTSTTAGGTLSQQSSSSNPSPNGGTLGYMPPTSTTGEPIRVSESTQQIWIAPWVDTAGNFHDSDYVYHVVTPGHWIGAPVQAVQGGN